MEKDKQAGTVHVADSGERYYSLGYVAELVGKTVLTLRNWCNWADEQEAQGEGRVERAVWADEPIQPQAVG